VSDDYAPIAPHKDEEILAGPAAGYCGVVAALTWTPPIDRLRTRELVTHVRCMRPLKPHKHAETHASQGRTVWVANTDRAVAEAGRYSPSVFAGIASPV
jgi:hypothetical protein